VLSIDSKCSEEDAEMVNLVGLWVGDRDGVVEICWLRGTGMRLGEREWKWKCKMLEEK
jgi:hypothetical protein